MVSRLTRCGMDGTSKSGCLKITHGRCTVRDYMLSHSFGSDTRVSCKNNLLYLSLGYIYSLPLPTSFYFLPSTYQTVEIENVNRSF